jgi:hypothetical protein
MTRPNEDYYAWTQETIEKLRQGRIAEVNTEDLIEELEDMGRSQRHELRSRLAVLLAHLLKWRYQPERRSNSWLFTIEEQRAQARLILRDNPSLKSQLTEVLNDAYRLAVIRAKKETDNTIVSPATFEQTDWSWEQVLDDAFYPGGMIQK